MPYHIVADKLASPTFSSQGRKAKLTPARHNWGADLIMMDPSNITIAVQGKRWNRKVGIDPIQEAVAVRAHFGCDCTMVITNFEFTEAAPILATSNDAELWNRNSLITEIITIKQLEESKGAQQG